MHRAPSSHERIDSSSSRSLPVSRGGLVLLACALVLVLLGVAACVAFSRSYGSHQTAVQLSPAPVDTRTLPAAQGPAETCEHHVVQALSRYVQQTSQGGDPNLAVSDAMQQLDSLEFQVFSSVLNSFLEADATGRQSGLAAQVKVVQPAIRRGCAQA